MIGFSCRSRMRPSCGKKYRDARKRNVSAKCIEAPRSQFVFTVPHRPMAFFKAHRKPMLSALFAAVAEAFTLLLKSHAPKACSRERRKLGFMNSLFARICASCKGELIAKEAGAMRRLQAEMRKPYPKGYYVHGPKFSGRTATRDMLELASYVARYASHPRISERRVASFDAASMTVAWFCDPHEDEEERIGGQCIAESADSFISRLLVHVPDKGFRQIRHCGFCSNKRSV